MSVPMDLMLEMGVVLKLSSRIATGTTLAKDSSAAIER
jgi:hypothetical protein